MRRIDWESKIDKAYFRGSPIGESQNFVNILKDFKNNNPRCQLFNMSIRDPSIVDAKPYLPIRQNTSINFFEEFSIQTTRQKVSKRQQMRFKYLISMDEQTAPYQRLPWSMLSKSIFLKQQTPRIQWFFDHLKPYQHYIPFNEDLSDLKQLVIFMRKNDQLMKDIAQTANLHAVNRFSQKRIYKDFLRIFRDYTQIQKIYQSPPDIQKLLKMGLKFVTNRRQRTYQVIYLPYPRVSFMEYVRANAVDIIQTLIFFGCILVVVLFKYSKKCDPIDLRFDLVKVKDTDI